MQPLNGHVTCWALAFFASLNSCGSVPRHYTQAPSIHKGLGYSVRQHTDDGFYLEIYLTLYHFGPARHKALANRLFMEVADMIAIQDSREIGDIDANALRVQSSYNEWSSMQTTIVAGPVPYRLFASNVTYRVRLQNGQTYVVLGRDIMRQGNTWELRRARQLGQDGSLGTESTVFLGSDTAEISPYKNL